MAEIFCENSHSRHTYTHPRTLARAQCHMIYLVGYPKHVHTVYYYYYKGYKIECCNIQYNTNTQK